MSHRKVETRKIDNRYGGIFWVQVWLGGGFHTLSALGLPKRSNMLITSRKFEMNVGSNNSTFTKPIKFFIFYLINLTVIAKLSPLCLSESSYLDMSFC